MNLEREELKFIINNVKYFLRPELMSCSDVVKYHIVYLRTMIGRYETDTNYGYKSLKQKDVRAIPDLGERVITTLARLYDYANIVVNEDRQLNEYVENKHIGSTIYEASHYIIAEALGYAINTSFIEHVEAVENPTLEDIVAMYDKRREPYDPIRNNEMLIWIRSRKNIEKYSDFKKLEVYHYVREDEHLV